MRKIFRLSFLGLASVLLLQLPAAFAYQLDSTNHILTVSPNTDSAKNTAELRSAFSYLLNRTDKTMPWTLKLNPGQYVMSAQVSTAGLQNTIITSADLSNPAKLSKMPGWDSATSAEYLLNFRMCKGVSLIGMEFYGQTSFANSVDPYWPDQGVVFGSCDTVKVDRNKFYNFGNGALRVVTDSSDPVRGVDSFRTLVSNNYFNNIYQTATTATDLVHGGTAQSTWINNTFINLRGSVKFASRTTGAQTIEFYNNLIDGGDHFGLEINNYSDFKIMGNTIQNVKVVAMNIYTEMDIPMGFSWGDNFTISNNTIKNVGRGIRYSHEAAPDGSQNVPSNLVIDSNTLINVADQYNWVPAIWVTNGTVNGVKITNNKLSGITNKNYIGVQQGSTNVSILSNTVDGVAYGAQATTATKSTTASAPVAIASGTAKVATPSKITTPKK